MADWADTTTGMCYADLGESRLNRTGIDRTIEEDVQVQTFGGRGNCQDVGVSDADMCQGLETESVTTMKVVGIIGVIV